LGDKFCGGSGDKFVIIGYYSAEKEWWNGVELKFHRSAITCVNFDPSGCFVISGSTDLRIGIHSAFAKEIDSKKTDLVCPFNEQFFKVQLNHILFTIIFLSRRLKLKFFVRRYLPG
jgi:hypothetical protein